jgi:hypothetical protein
MSDDLPPLGGQVRLDDVSRLDAVDFTPILAPLQCLAESARQCAGLITADGRTGSAGLRLLSQLDERWRAFEAAIVRAGLTENAPLMIYGNDPPVVEQGIAVVYELWDLLSHRRRGRFDGADGLSMLAKQADAAAELVQALTLSAPPAAALGKPEDSPELVGAMSLESLWSPHFASYKAFRRAVVEGGQVRYEARGRRFLVNMQDVRRLVAGLPKSRDDPPEQRDGRKTKPSEADLDLGLRPEHERRRDEIRRQNERRMGGGK